MCTARFAAARGRTAPPRTRSPWQHVVGAPPLVELRPEDAGAHRRIVLEQRLRLFQGNAAEHDDSGDFVVAFDCARRGQFACAPQLRDEFLVRGELAAVPRRSAQENREGMHTHVLRRLRILLVQLAILRADAGGAAPRVYVELVAMVDYG